LSFQIFSPVSILAVFPNEVNNPVCDGVLSLNNNIPRSNIAAGFSFFSLNGLERLLFFSADLIVSRQNAMAALRKMRQWNQLR